ncbi:hypothetical protein LX36DRAFT_377295 [Colletotrichum falcatum]|nr:hypothetical protein LX36DRAFT_377295 [Colletotrichum falcatum]
MAAAVLLPWREGFPGPHPSCRPCASTGVAEEYLGDRSLALLYGCWARAMRMGWLHSRCMVSRGALGGARRFMVMAQAVSRTLHVLVQVAADITHGDRNGFIRISSLGYAEWANAICANKRKPCVACEERSKRSDRSNRRRKKNWIGKRGQQRKTTWPTLQHVFDDGEVGISRLKTRRQPGSCPFGEPSGQGKWKGDRLAPTAKKETGEPSPGLGWVWPFLLLLLLLLLALPLLSPRAFLFSKRDYQTSGWTYYVAVALSDSRRHESQATY